MKNFVFIMIVLMACYHCSEGSPPSVSEKVGQTGSRVAADQASNINQATIPKGAGSQKAYLDPETGELIPPSEHKGVEADRAESEPPSADTESAEDIVEEKSPVPGGGVMIDLKERFRNPSGATVESGSEQLTSDNSK